MSAQKPEHRRSSSAGLIGPCEPDCPACAQGLEALLERGIQHLPESDRRLCRALLRAIRHVQAAPAVSPLPDRLIDDVTAWYRDHKSEVLRTPEGLAAIVDHLAALPPNALAEILAETGAKVPQSGRLAKKLSVDRADPSEATAFSVTGRLVGLTEKTVKTRVSAARRNKPG